MRFGVFTFAGVEMDDRGAGTPAPVDRRYDNEVVWDTTERLIELGIAADRLDYESFWFTEHHFQYEGYEVTPNGIQLCTWLAAKTNQIKLGTMFNVVPQWHPLRLAEDFATLHNLSGGRGLLGVGRGTVPREVQSLSPFGVSIGSQPVGPGLIPSLEESIDNKTWVVGTPEDVAEGIAFYRDTIGVDYITLFPQFAGDPYGLVEDQLHRFAEDVIPLLG